MALTENFNVPALAQVTEDDLTQMRANWNYLALAAGKSALVLPGWTTTITSSSSPQNFALPDYMVIAKTYTTVSPNITVQYKYIYTWTGSNLTTIVYQFDDGGGGGFVTVTGGTITQTFDGLGNLTGATSA